jgi:hypothetical protein
MYGDDLVHWSVAEANRQRGGRSSRGPACQCGNDLWRARNGVDERYRSQYNPGEYVEFTCTNCGYSYEEQS